MTRQSRIRISSRPSRIRSHVSALAFLLTLCLLVASATGVAGVERGLVDTSASPYAKVRSVGLDEVTWTSGFWAERQAVCRSSTLPGLWSVMEGTNYSQFYQNFKIAAGLAEGRHRGAPFNDGDFYKWLEGSCAILLTGRDAQRAQRLDDVISVIAKAQRPDGYLHTGVLIRQRNGDSEARPFHDRLQFEMYNLGHLFTAACVHYHATGQTNLLDVACRAADFLETTFHQPTPDLALQSICPSHYMGLVELYRATRQPRYLALARKLFAMRALVADGSDDNQDRIPFDRQTNAMGHAVRANYLYAGAADLFLETGDRSLWASLEQIWTNLVGAKMYITGGCGALYDGASPDGGKDQKSISRVHQAYGRAFQLPNLTAHAETCANIGNVLWNWRMFLATGEARFVDVLELALYNSVLSGVSLDGTNYFYVNPLRTVEPMPVELRWQHRRVPFLSSFCCPPNLARTVAEVGAYAYAKSDGALWVNLYGANRVATTLPAGEKVALTQETSYPWNGVIRLRVDQADGGAFTLRLRIPAGAVGASIRVNWRPVDMGLSPGTYAEIRRPWRAGDVVDLDLPMPPRLIEANPLVEETLNQVTLKRGPLVYCLESPDLPSGVKARDVFISPGRGWVARYDQRLLGGVVVLQGSALARAPGTWSADLYREYHYPPFTPIRVCLIPYFTWANRGHSDMSVWLPLATSE